MTVRLLPDATSADLRDALEARVHDGLLLLGRQWQFGEHVGDDAGSPVSVALELEHAPLGALRPGGGAPIPYDPRSAPLHPLVESEPLGGLADRDYGLRIEAAQQFLRLLDAHGAPDCRAPYRAAYAWTIGPAELAALDDASRARLDLVAGRLPDPEGLAADLRDALGATGSEPGELPERPELLVDQRGPALAAARAWLGWLGDQGRSEPPAAVSSWQPDRLEYRFAVDARHGDAGVSLPAPEFAADRLDWHAFRLGPPVPDDGLPATRTLTTTVLPSALQFRGMPADRYWQFEDARVSWDSATLDASAVATAVLLEFALVTGPDWFVVPVELEAGALAHVRSLVVTDTFDERLRVRHAGEVDGPGAPWRLFTLAPEPGAAADDTALLVTPTLGSVLTGEPLEDVLLVRDEQANLAWAVERLVEGPAGGVLDRYEEYQQRLESRPERPRANGDAPRYHLGSDVPHHWIPLVPEPIEAPAPATMLRRAAIARPDVPPGPSGRLLRGADPFRLHTEEVPREGAHVTRAYRYARWSDGSTHLWVTRRKEPGRGEGSSGLRFDWLE